MKAGTKTKQFLGFELDIYEELGVREITIICRHKVNDVIVYSTFDKVKKAWSDPKLRFMSHKDKTIEELSEFATLMSFNVMVLNNFPSYF